MPRTLAVLHHEFGVPAAVARCESIEIPEPGPGDVLVRMRVAPIHPADLNRLEGRYGENPKLPAVGGIEGFGTIERIGSAVTGLESGMPVAVSPGVGTWSERVIAPVSRVFPVPPSVTPETGALLIVNPATAWRMLADFVELREGEWVLLNAANSSVGRCVIEIAHARKWRTVALVRRPELIRELKGLGADAVLLDENGVVEQIKELTESERPRLALNAVGGASALRMANALAPGGTLVTYGAMGRQPLQIPNGLLIFKDLQYRGFWVTRWFRQASAAEIGAMMDGIRALAASGRLSAPVAAEFPLAEAAQALDAAAQDRREGKILFRM